MRVLVAPHHFGALLRPSLVADALALGWRRSRDGDEILTHPMSDGSAGFLDALGAPGLLPRFATGEVITVSHAGTGHPVPILRAGSGEEPWHTVYAHIAPFHTDAPLTPESLAAASSYGVGALLADLVTRGARKIVLGVGLAPWHDGGAGLLRGLADGLAPEVTPSAARIQALVGLLGPLREALAGVDVVIASANEAPLRGLHGAGAALANLPGVTLADAQALEKLTADFVTGVDDLVPSLGPRDLLAASSPQLHSRRAHSGAGGGVAFVLAALGARVLPGAWVVAEETSLASRLEGVDLVVTGAGIVAGHELADGVIAEVAERAEPHAIPVIVVGGRIDASRRQLNKVGVHASYPVNAPFAGRPQVTAAPATEVGLVDRGERLAKTWSRG